MLIELSTCYNLFHLSDMDQVWKSKYLDIYFHHHILGAKWI